MKIRQTAVAVLALLGLVASGCGGSGPKDQPSPVDPLDNQPAGSYTTRGFIVPLTVAPAPGLERRPIDVVHLLSWDSATKEDNKIRFLAPVEIYRPGATKAEAVPADFPAYVQSLAAAGVTMTDKKQIQVGGKPATLLTMTRTAGAKVDGVLGCPEHGDDQVEDCFAPQPTLVMRIAVFEVVDQPVLAWARVPSAQPDQAFLDGFETMLGTVTFH